MRIQVPAVGDVTTFTEYTKYTPIQYRPVPCRAGLCVCGECSAKVEHTGTVEDVLKFADNSVEVNVRCADGKLRRRMVVAPNGDVC